MATSLCERNFALSCHVFDSDRKDGKWLPVKLSTITDGTNNTFSCGERDMKKNVAACWIGRVEGVTDAMTYGRGALLINTPLLLAQPVACVQPARYT